jgi:hypothetical protein
MTRAADILWRSFKAPKSLIARANGDARKVLQAALDGRELEPTASEASPREPGRQLMSGAPEGVCVCGHAILEHVNRNHRRECTVCTCNAEDVRL